MNRARPALLLLAALAAPTAAAFCPFTLDRAYRFHGLVTDQHAQPVAGVHAAVNVTRRGTRVGELLRGLAWAGPAHESIDVRSDTAGRIEFRGCGTSISMTLSRDGYAIQPIWSLDLMAPSTQEAPPGDATFYVEMSRVNWGSERRRIEATRAQPLPIPAWRLGEPAADLVLVGDRDIGEIHALKSDGRVYTIDLLAPAGGRVLHRPDAPGDFHIAVRREWQGADRAPRTYAWSAQLSAIGGGLVAAQDPFLFQAPASGYQPELRMAAPRDGERNQPSRLYYPLYLRSRGGAVYAALQLTFDPARAPGESALELQATVNTHGSTNLQPVRLPSAFDPQMFPP